MNHNLQEMIDLHVNQAYDDDRSYQIDLDSLSKKYSVLPNECAYMIDCKSAELVLLDKKFSHITEVPEASGKIIPLYEHVKNTQLDSFLANTINIVSKYAFGKYRHLMQNEVDWVNMIYKTGKGKTLLKSTTGLISSPNGIVRYTIGKITDISGLGHSGQFSYTFFGPNASAMQATLDGIAETIPYLTKRELQILGLVGNGKRSHEIASLLNISKLTVDTHRKNIAHKLETSGSIMAYNKAKDIGLI